MAAVLAGLPLWLWLLWIALVFVTAIVLAPRRERVPSGTAKRLQRIGGQVLLGVAIVQVRADTALVATVLAALGGAVYGNAAGTQREKRGD